MTNHLSSIADLEVIGKDTVRKEAETAIDEAISIFDQVNFHRLNIEIQLYFR